MKPELILGIWGSVTGTIGLLFQGRQHYLNRAKFTIRATSLIESEEYVRRVLEVCVVNTGQCGSSSTVLLRIVAIRLMHYENSQGEAWIAKRFASFLTDVFGEESEMQGHVMRNPLIALMAFLVAANLDAQINILTTGQAVSAFGSAQVGSLPATNYSESGSVSASGSVFTQSGSLLPTPKSSASEDTGVTGSQILFSSDVSVAAGIGLTGAGMGENCYAEADLSFSASFNVFSPVMYNLTVQYLDEGGIENNLTRQCTFSSVNTGVIESGVTPDQGITGVLVPGDTYTVGLSEQLTDPYPDPYGSGGQFELDFNFTAVPEPPSSVLGTASASVLIGYLYRRGKKQKRLSRLAGTPPVSPQQRVAAPQLARAA